MPPIDWSGILGVGGPWAITFGLLVGLFTALQRSKLLPEKAHLRELASRDREISARDEIIKVLREEQAAEVATLRDRHDNYMRIMIENHARENESRERELERSHRDLSDWRTAYHLAAEAGKVEAAQLGELVEGYRLILSLIQALPKVQYGELPEVNDSAGRGATGRG